MKKLLVGLTLLTSMSSFAITELQFSGYAAKSAYDGMTDVSIKDYGFQKEKQGQSISCLRLNASIDSNDVFYQCTLTMNSKGEVLEQEN